MSKLTEEKIEIFLLSLLENLGYEYKHGVVISPDGDKQERQTYSDVILKDRLIHAINTLNPTIPADALNQAQGRNWQY